MRAILLSLIAFLGLAGIALAQTSSPSPQWCVKTVFQYEPGDCNRKVVTETSVVQPVITTATAARAEMLAQAGLLRDQGGITPEKMAAEQKRLSLTLPASADYCHFSLRSETSGNYVSVTAWRPRATF